MCDNGHPRTAISGSQLQSGKQTQGVQDPCTMIDPSLCSLRFAVVFVIAFYWEKYSTKSLLCQHGSQMVSGGVKQSVKRIKFMRKGGKILK